VPSTPRASGPRDSQKEEVFFFEKKNQKTFICLGLPYAGHVRRRPEAKSKSFLFLFFKKEILPFSADAHG